MKVLLPCWLNWNRRARQIYVPPYLMAKIYGTLGQKDRAFALLDQAVEERDFQLLPIKLDPTADVLRSDPRFDSVLRKMHLAN